jgi:hypothetical protein
MRIVTGLRPAWALGGIFGLFCKSSLLLNQETGNIKKRLLKVYGSQTTTSVALSTKHASLHLRVCTTDLERSAGSTKKIHRNAKARKMQKCEAGEGLDKTGEVRNEPYCKYNG